MKSSLNGGARNHLTGVPWRMEYLKMSDNDSKRHKTRCIHYTPYRCDKVGYKCPGSAHCEFYMEDSKQNNYKKYNVVKKKKNIDYTDKEEKIYKSRIRFYYNDKKYQLNDLNGTFSIKFILDGSIYNFNIGKNIKSDAPIVKEVILNKIHSTFEMGNVKMLLLNKNLYIKDSNGKIVNIHSNDVKISR